MPKHLSWTEIKSLITMPEADRRAFLISKKFSSGWNSGDGEAERNTFKIRTILGAASPTPDMAGDFFADVVFPRKNKSLNIINWTFTDDNKTAIVENVSELSQLSFPVVYAIDNKKELEKIMENCLRDGFRLMTAFQGKNRSTDFNGSDAYLSSFEYYSNEQYSNDNYRLLLCKTTHIKLPANKPYDIYYNIIAIKLDVPLA